MTTKVHRPHHKAMLSSWYGLSALADFRLYYYIDALYIWAFLKVGISARQAAANGLGDQE